MKKLLALLFLLLLAQVSVPPFPGSPTLNQQAVGPGNQLYRWDGTKWIHVSGGSTAFAPINNPNFTGTVTIDNTAITSLFAPFNNPTNGIRNYAPLAGPTFTGTATVPTLVVNTTATLPNTTATRLGVNRTVPSTNGVVDVSSGYQIGGVSQFATGTWTMSIQCSGGNPSMQSFGQNSTWTQVGNMIYVSGFGVWAGRTGGAGDARIGGLPNMPTNLGGVNQAVGFLDIMITNATPYNGYLWNAGNPQNMWLGARMMGYVQEGTQAVKVNETDYGPYGFLVPTSCDQAFKNQASGVYVSGWYRNR